MNKSPTIDFRESFTKMADQAVINRSELAELLATTQGAVSQMAYRGELPTPAFPGKRRACWFARDIRQWLNDISANRQNASTDTLGRNVSSDSTIEKRNGGRPRLPV